MAKVSQDIKISCHNSVIKGTLAKSNDGHPWRNWKITLVAMEGEKEIKGKLSIILDHVCYILHPTFEEPRRVKTEEPYVLEEKGWGEFDMRILLYFADNLTDPKVLTFDLNFAQSNYSITRKVEFPNASPELIKLLATDPSTTSTNTLRKGGKKPISSITTSISTSGSSKSKSKTNNDNNNSRQQAKKKPVSSSPHTKTAKKAKPESKEKAKSQKLSHSPTPHTPLLNTSSPVTHSSPSNSHITSDTPESALSLEEKNNLSKYSPTHTNDEDVEHIYNMSDVYNLSSIHRAKIDEETRDRWGIPEINMMELAKRIYRMTPEQSAEFQNIILNNRTDDMRLAAEEDGGFGIDLYSLGSTLLEKLWDYSADMASEDNQSYTSQDIHASDLELDSDMEQGEYNSDDDGGIRISYGDGGDDSNTEREEGEEGDYSRYGSGAYEPTGYREIGEYHYTPDHNNIVHNSGADEPGFHFSDSDTGDHHHNHHTTNGIVNHPSNNGGYHDTSDMDIQDDDDY